jgi:hypothetical protein
MSNNTENEYFALKISILIFLINEHDDLQMSKSVSHCLLSQRMLNLDEIYPYHTASVHEQKHI